MAIKIEMLRCFSTVAQTGNLAVAAQRLGRTQSAISMTLKQLEDHLGQRLFESDRKNRLTTLGEQVFELAQGQLRQFDETVRTIETSAKSPRGLIRIASIPSVAGLILPRAIGKLTRLHPCLKIELRDTDTPQVIDALTHGRADVGIASGRHALNGIRQTPLFADRFGLICAPGHPLALQKAAPTIRDVVSAGFIRNDLCSLIATPDFQAAIAAAALTAHNTLSLIAMVRSENWVTVLPKAVVQIAPNDLIFREIVDLRHQREVNLLLRESSQYLQFAEDLEALITNTDWALTAEPTSSGKAVAD